MREIKFRAWNIQQNKFINLSALDFHRLESACVQEIGTPPHFYPKTYPADENILTQFTGLKDKNGKDIYESDIIKWSFVNTGESDDDNKFYIEIVKWSECGFFLDGGAPLTVAMDDCEVIGNVFKNPELIK